MRVAFGEAICGEVFAAAEDVLFAHPAVEEAGFVDDVLAVLPPAAATESVFLGGKMVEVEDGGEVEVDAEELEEASGVGTEEGDLLEGGFLGKSLGVGRCGAEFSGAPDAAAFLIDGDERLIE